MSLETDQQKLEQQKLEQAKQEKSSTPENNQESTDNKFTTDTGEKLAEWRSQRENKESSEGTEGASDTGRRSLDIVKEQLAQENSQSLDDNLDNRNLESNQDITVGKLAEWRSQRENKESSEGTEGASDTGRRSLDIVKEQLAQENNPSLNDNLDNRNVEPNQDISPEDSRQDDTELEKQRKNKESDINRAEDESNNAKGEAQKAKEKYEEALRAEQKPDLSDLLKAEKNVQDTSDKATEAEKNLQDLRRQLEDLPKPKR
ncbi:MAG: hypothetical protein WCO29_12460 [Nostocales cyanobacterium ELA583]|jgi:hypothetical protein